MLKHNLRGVRRLIVVVSCSCVTMLGAGRASAQGPSAAESHVVVARVGGEAVFAGEVERLLGKVIGGKKVNQAILPVFQAQVLSEIVDRRLVLAYARRTKSGVSESETDAALAEFAARMQAQGRSLEQYLKDESLTEAELRRKITWNLVWEKYLARYITEERLASYFAAHAREFDGTEISVSHILLKKVTGTFCAEHPSGLSGKRCLSPFSPGAMEELIKRARAVREEIVSGSLSFAEAAGKYSAGPSAKEGGRLGFIGRRGPMVESFSQAAFALEVGQVSEPVVTQFGVHLIRCDEIKPGTKQLADVRKELEDALARDLLEKLARFEERHTPVEFTGTWPHFKPGTRELVVP